MSTTTSPRAARATIKRLTDHHAGPCLVIERHPHGGTALWVQAFVSEAERRARRPFVILHVTRGKKRKSGAIHLEGFDDVTSGEQLALLQDALEHAGEIVRAQTGGDW